jgi:hypothetical protein
MKEKVMQVPATLFTIMLSDILVFVLCDSFAGVEGVKGKDERAS